MDVVPGVFTEADISAMTPKCLQLLGSLCNSVIASYIVKYCESVEADQTVVQKIKENIWNSIYVMTIPSLMRERGISQLVYRFTLQTVAATQPLEVDEMLENFHIALDISRTVPTQTVGRKKADFDEFISLLSRQDKTGLLSKKVRDNKKAFCPSGEKSKGNGLGAFTRRRGDIEIAYKGLQYIKLCNDLNLNYLNRGGFF